MSLSDNGSPEACTANQPAHASLCSCNRTQGGFIVDCSSRRLTLIPRIPSTTTELYVQNNLIQQLSTHQFNESKMLTVINLSHNVIAAVPTTVFSGLHVSTLETLDISNNNLKHISFPLTALKQIQYLNFSNNTLEQFSESTINEIDDLVANHSSGISIDLSGNKLRCDCDTKPFMKWRLKTEINFVFNDTYMCTLANGTTRPFNQNLRDLVKQLDQDCIISKYDQSIPALGVLLGLMVILFLSIQHLYNVRKQCKTRSKRIALDVQENAERHRKTRSKRIALDVQENAELTGELDEHDDYTYEYDAFISYENDDHAVGHTECILELEEKRELRLCVHERQFRPGERIGHNISEAISNSKRVALLVSRTFLKSNWCMYELDIARCRAVEERRKLILIVMLEDIPTCEQKAEILDITRVYTYLKYPDGEDEHEKTLFWDKFAYFINGPSRPEPDEDDDYTYKYDAFISYTSDENAVGDIECILELEEKRELRLCVYERDFICGTNISDSISEGMINSKRIAFLVSRKFLESYWCMYELHVAADRKQKAILIVMIEDIRSCELSADTRNIIRMSTSLKYPDGEDEHAKTVFWDKFAAFINGPSRLHVDR